MTMDSPGPGNYAISFIDKESSPQYGFGSSKRDDGKKFNSPGPGNYQIPSQVGVGVKNSIHIKIKENMPSITPGPGKYESSLGHMTTAPSYGMSFKPKATRLEAGPGAQTYLP